MHGLWRVRLGAFSIGADDIRAHRCFAGRASGSAWSAQKDKDRTLLRRLLLAVVLACSVALLIGVMGSKDARAQAGPCETYRITGYVHTGNLTADGTVTYGNEWQITAASYNLPLGSYVWVEGIGVLRVADRGHLGPRHLDVLVGSVSEAYQLTGYRAACPL